MNKKKRISKDKSYEQWFNELLDNFKGEVEFQKERILIEYLEDIHKILGDRGISDEEFADMLGISKKKFDRIYNGDEADLDIIIKMAGVLGYIVKIKLARRK